MFFEKKHEMVRQLASEFAKRELTKEILDEVEETGVFPKEILDKMAKAGMFGIKAPKEFGGAAGDNVSYVIVMEEIAKASGVASLYISSPSSLNGTPLLTAGTKEQKEKYLKPMATGEKMFCFALTEPGAGSDAGSMLTTAVQDGDNWILNGRKCFITAAPLADYAIVFAKTDMTKGTKGITAFIVDMKAEGVSTGKPEEKMGLIGCATSDILLEDVIVHKSDMLGALNKGFSIAMRTLDIGRMGVAAQAIGMAQAAIDEAVTFTKERKQFGKPIASFQGLRFMLADMETKLNAARLLTYDAAMIKDRGQDNSKAAAMAKYYATEACNEIVAKAVQLHGGYGFIKEYKVERLYRDARVLTIYEGTSQVQQMVIAGSIL